MIKSRIAEILAQWITVGASSKKVIANSAWLFMDKFARLAIGLFVGAWVARYLGPAEFGELAYILAILSLFQIISSLGLDSIAVRDISQSQQSTSDVLGTIFGLRLITGFVCYVVLLFGLAAFHGRAEKTVELAALAAASLLFQPVDSIDLWFQSNSQSWRTVSARLMAYFLGACSRAYLIFSNAGIHSFAIMVSVEALLSATFLAISYRFSPNRQVWRFDSKMAVRMLRECWPLTLGGVAVLIYIRIDQLMIREVLGLRDLGVYAAVLPIATFWQIVPVVLNTSLAPYLFKQRVNDIERYKNSLYRIFKYYAWASWVLSIFTMVASGMIINFMYGPQYKDGTSVLAIYAFTNVFLFMGVAQNIWIINERKNTVTLVNTCAGAVVCFICNTILLPRVGLSGAAISAVISQATAAMFSNYFFSRELFMMQLSAVSLGLYKFRQT